MKGEGIDVNEGHRWCTDEDSYHLEIVKISSETAGDLLPRLEKLKKANEGIRLKVLRGS